jgi:hypothetical protein
MTHRRDRRRVIIESPYAGDRERNLTSSASPMACAKESAMPFALAV